MRYFAVAVLSASTLLLSGVPGGAQSDAQYRQVADKVVGQLLSVKPGDVVVVYADPTHLALVDEVATSVRAAGAHPIVSMGDNHYRKPVRRRGRWSSVTRESTVRSYRR